MTHSLLVRQYVSAPVAQVYEAWTDLAIARTWSAPEGVELARFDADFKVGGKYSLQMKLPDGTLLGANGVYRLVEPRRKLEYTWVWDVPDTEENLVTVDFRELGAGTEVVLSVTGFSVADEVESNRQGWASSLGRLAQRFAKSKI